MASRETIDNPTLSYGLIRSLFGRPTFNRYFRKIEIHRACKQSKGEPIIFASNHQNALMDALALSALPWYHQSVFFARADVFKSKAVINLLTITKIMPVYRMRDGVKNLQKNDEIFDYAVKFLQNKKCTITLYPEGNHGDKRRIRMLQKGLFRIAFKAQNDYGKANGIKIIPIGLDYGHYQKFRSTLLIQYGNPIEVSEYWDVYEENNAKGINALRERLSAEIKKLAIHIESDEYYDFYMDGRELFRDITAGEYELPTRTLQHKFKVDKKTIEVIDRELEKNEDTLKAQKEKHIEFAKIRDKFNLRNWVFKKNSYSVLLEVIRLLFSLPLLPLAILGLFNNWPHFILPAKMDGKIKDPQFKSTFKWGVGSILMAVYFLILIILAFAFMPVWWWALIYSLTLFKMGQITLYFRKIWVKALSRMRYTFNKNNSELVKAKKLYTEMRDSYTAMLNDFKGTL